MVLMEHILASMANFGKGGVSEAFTIKEMLTDKVD